MIEAFNRYKYKEHNFAYRSHLEVWLRVIVWLIEVGYKSAFGAPLECWLLAVLKDTYYNQVYALR